MGGGGGGGLFGQVGEFIYGDGGAEAAGNAAIAGQIEAGRNYREIKGRVDSTSANFGTRMGAAQSSLQGATVSGLMDMDKAMGLQEKNLSRQEQLVSQIDPTIIEASQQALRLLRGEQSSTLNPLKAQRDQQRQKVVNMLREQLGPGAETSTAGIQALTRFDSETSNIMAGAQQQALSGLGGVAGQFNSVRPDMFREIMGFGSMGQQKYGMRAAESGFMSDWANQEANFGMQGANLLNTAANPMYQSAGAGYVSSAMRGQQAASFGQQALGMAVGGAIGGKDGALAMGGAKKPAA